MPNSAVKAGADVDNRDADAHRPLAGLAGDRHQAAHALNDLIDAGALAVRAFLAEGRDAGVHQARIDLLQRLVVELEAGLDVGTEILHQHVGLLDHRVEDLAALLALEIDGHAPLVAVLVLEVPFLAAGKVRRIAGPLDLDDVGAPVGELPHADRARAHMGHVENDEAFERSGCRLVSHRILHATD
jgi:hypothetical protein